jgi:phage gpG-like protein
MSARFTAKGKGLDELKALVKQLGEQPQIKIGVLTGSGASVGRGDGSTLSNVELAAIHEFGAPRAGIPQRSFLRDTADLKRDEWIAFLVRALKVVVAGRMPLETALDLTGQRAVADVLARIRQGKGIPPLPLAPATIKAKKSSRPLVDTGRLVQSIAYQVVRKAR